MAGGRLPASEIVDELIALAVAPTLEVAGFFRTGRDFYRRHGEAVQLVNVLEKVQSVRYKDCCIYVGIAFDPMCRLAGLPVLERPVIFRPGASDFRFRGTYDRLESLIPGVWAWWSVRVRQGVGQGIEEVVGNLRPAIVRLAAELERIDGLDVYRVHPWFDRTRPSPERVQVLYLLGDLDGASRELEAVVADFAAEWPGVETPGPDWWVERLNLADLRQRRAGDAG
jgi:hypothetical protein